MCNKPKEILLEEFLHRINASNNPCLICGNGLSINFEPQLTLQHLGNNLYKTHLYILTYGDYRIINNSKLNDVYKPNFQNVKRYLKKNIRSNDELEKLLSGAISFAKNILSSQKTIDWLKENGFISNLSMGFSTLDYITNLIYQADRYGVLGSNYEYWSLLVYFVLALNDAPAVLNSFSDENEFAKVVLIGSEKTMGFSKKLGISYYSKVCENGMYIYLRLLLSSNILLTGNGFHVEQMSIWNNFQKEKLRSFFSLFQNLITTNYDLVIEKICNRFVSHLHGFFSKQLQASLYQTFGVYKKAIRYDLSTLIIGDYFVSKIFFAITASMSRKCFFNTHIDTCSDILRRIIKEGKTDTVVIFGLNIDNDYHILRHLQIYLEAGGIESTNIIFCYYSQEDRKAFLQAYKSCITYSEELNNYAINNISVYTLNSHLILNKYFVPNA